MRPVFKATTDQLNSLKGRGNPVESIKKLLSDLSNHAKNNYGVYVDTNNILAKSFDPDLQSDFSMADQLAQRSEMPSTIEGWEAAQNQSGVASKENYLTNMQNKLRQMVGLPPKADQPFDRQLVRVLRTNYPEAWALVQQKGSLKSIMDAISQEGKGVASKEQMLPPEPPGAPLGREGLENIYRGLVNSISRKYPRINVGDRQWSAVRERLWQATQQFNSEDVSGQMAQVIKELDVPTMNSLRRGLAPPSAPVAQMGR